MIPADASLIDLAPALDAAKRHWIDDRMTLIGCDQGSMVLAGKDEDGLMFLRGVSSSQHYHKFYLDSTTKGSGSMVLLHTLIRQGFEGGNPSLKSGSTSGDHISRNTADARFANNRLSDGGTQRANQTRNIR